MKGLAAFLIGVGKVSALEPSKVAELLNFFESNQNRYQINVEQHCKMGDLPLLEYTDYGCKEVLERTLTHGKTCAFSCINDAGETGAATCLCDNDDSAVTSGAKCKWKFPDYTPACGPIRMNWVNNKLEDLAEENAQTLSEVGGLRVSHTQLENTLGLITEQISTVDALVDTNHQAALLALENEADEQDDARENLETDLMTEINSLKTADVNLQNTVTANGNVLDGVAQTASDNEADILDHEERVHQNEQDISTLNTQQTAKHTELSNEIAGVMTSLTSQIAKQETDRLSAETDIQNNKDHSDAMDVIHGNEIIDLKAELEAEIARGALRDDQLTNADGDVIDLQTAIAGNTELIGVTQTELNTKFIFLTNYTDNAVEAKGVELEGDMALQKTLLDGVDADLAAEDARIDALVAANSDLIADLDADAVARDAVITEQDNTLGDLQNQITSNDGDIDLVQANVDSEANTRNLTLQLAKQELWAGINTLRADMDAADGNLGNSISTSDGAANLTTLDLHNEIAAGLARDARMDAIDAEIAENDGLIADNTQLVADTRSDLEADDLALTNTVAANLVNVTNAINTVATDLVNTEAALTLVDEGLQSSIDDTDANLAAEVAAGEARDVLIADHATRITNAEEDIVQNTDDIAALTDTVSDNYDTLDTKIDTTDTNIRTDMGTLQTNLEATDAALAAADDATNAALDITNDNLATETLSNDNQDIILTSHTDTLSAHSANLITLGDDIDTVQSNLDSEVATLTTLVSDTKTELETDLTAAETALEAADAALTSANSATQTDLDNTKTALDAEVSLGEVRQSSLDDHNVRLTVMRGDVDANALAIAQLDGGTTGEITIIHDEIANSSDVTVNMIHDLDRRLSFEDSNLRNEDTKIRGEMTQQKFLIEKKMQNDIDTVDRSIRNHFANEIYQVDHKLTNSINALSHKQQEDISEIQDALDFFWGVYKPTKVVLFEGVYQPQVGHLLSILPHVYRIWHLEVDIMPYKKNHYSWVNLLHFTASGDNYGRPGDRMPLISLYPGENILHIACYINNEVSYAYDSDYVLPMHRWTKLEVGQTYLGGQFVYYVKLNGKQVYSVVNNYPMDFYNMMVYGCDPWSEAPFAKLRNLEFTTSWGPNIVSVLSPVGGIGHYHSEGNEDRSAGTDTEIPNTGTPVAGRSGEEGEE